VFNKPLLKQTIKYNFKLFAIITGVLCLLITIIMSVFVPSTIANIKTASANAPINPLGDISSLIAFISNQFYGMMAIIFPMIYLIVIGNKLIAGQIDKGSMAYNLLTPTSRTEIASTGALYLAGSLGVMFGLIAVVGITLAAIVQPGVLPDRTFLMLTLGCFLLQFALSAVAFFASCLFNSSSKSLSLGAGIPLAFFALKLISGMSDKLKFLKFFSLNTLFDTTAIMGGSGYAINLITLTAFGVILYAAGIYVFKKKDLPL